MPVKLPTSLIYFCECRIRKKEKKVVPTPGAFAITEGGKEQHSLH